MLTTVRDTLASLAMQNDGIRGRYKIAAGLIYKKRLILTGVNSYKTHPIMMNREYREEQIHLHAEADVIQKALRQGIDLSQTSLYVVRVTKTGKEAMAKPCNGCMALIAEYGIKDVEYTKDGP